MRKQREEDKKRQQTAIVFKKKKKKEGEKCLLPLVSHHVSSTITLTGMRKVYDNDSRRNESQSRQATIIKGISTQPEAMHCKHLKTQPLCDLEKDFSLFENKIQEGRKEKIDRISTPDFKHRHYRTQPA